MPRFFFHVYDDVETRDEEGRDLPDLAAAEAVALAGARDLMCEQVRQGRLTLDHRIDVEDEAGNKLIVLPFKKAVDLRR